MWKSTNVSKFKGLERKGRGDDIVKTPQNKRNNFKKNKDKERLCTSESFLHLKIRFLMIRNGKWRMKLKIDPWSVDQYV